MNENKKQVWELISNFESKVFGNVDIHKTIDGKMTSFKSNGSKYGLSIKEFTMKLSAVNDDKLIADTVKVFASYYDANFYGKMIKDTTDNKEYSIEHFRNIVIQNNENIETVTNNHLMNVINDKDNTFILIDEIGTVNEPSTINKFVIKDVTNTIKNNSYEGTNNVEVVKAFSNDEIIRFKAWYLDIKDTAKTYKEGSKAAKVYFILSKGEVPLLDIQLRYKGSFTAMPQFFATMTTDFQKLLKDGGCSEIHR